MENVVDRYFAKTDISSRLGSGMVLSGLLVSIPLLLLALFHLKSYQPNATIEVLCYLSSAIGLAIVATGGGAYIGHTLVTQKLFRWFLAPAWLVMLTGLIYLIAGYLLAVYTGQSLLAVLSPDWLLEHRMIVLYVVAAIAVPEIGVVSSLVAVAIHKQRQGDFEHLRGDFAQAVSARRDAEQRLAAAEAEVARLQLVTVQKGSRGRKNHREQILNLLRQANGEALTQAALLRELPGVSRSVAAKHLAILTADGIVERVAAPAGSTARHAYRLCKLDTAAPEVA